LYNRAVFDVLEQEKGAGQAVLFARSATAGGQQMPVHWGGDNSSSFESMAETLRGGLSLTLSGFGYWSHDIGGFEGNPDPAVFKRWLAFGLLSSHSRLHASSSYRVPWAFDSGDEAAGQGAVEVTRRFTQLKLSLMPYLYEVGREAHERGLPFMRAMALAFPDDPSAAYLDRQYMIGDQLLVAPVFSAEGQVEYYLPAGEWTNLLTGERAAGGVWRREVHGFDSLPLWVRGGSVLVTGSRNDRPDVDYRVDPLVTVYPGFSGERVVRVTNPLDGTEQLLTVTASSADAEVTVVSSDGGEFRAARADAEPVSSVSGTATLS
ncbi:MAG: TIM-barrel domain-containing protein, partial [Mycetocola sp.]